MNKIKLIVAIAANGVIGKDGALPWSHKEDMRHFVQTTKDDSVANFLIMGYKTWESLGKRALPGRVSLVYSSRPINPPIQKISSDCFLFSDIRDILTFLHLNPEGEAFLIGGAATYEKFLEADLVDELIVTNLDFQADGDTFMNVGQNWAEYDSEKIAHDATVRYYKKIGLP